MTHPTPRRSLLTATAAALLALPACKLSSTSARRVAPPAARSVSDAGPLTATATPDAAARSSADAGTAAAGVPVHPVRRVRATLRELPPFETRSLTVGEPVLSGGHFSRWQRPWNDAPRRWVMIRQSPSPNAQPSTSFVLDVTNGRRSPAFHAPHEISERAGVAVVFPTADSSSALLRLEDGTIRVPRPSAPNGQPITTPRVSNWPRGRTLPDDLRPPLISVVARSESPDVWVVAREGNGNEYFGRWRDFTRDDVLLAHHAPSTLNTYGYDPATGAIEVTAREGAPVGVAQPDAPCVRYRLADEGNAVCLARQGLNERITTHWIGGDWAWHRGIVNTRLRTVQPFPLRGCLAQQALASPPRLFLRCDPPGADPSREITLALWTPEAIGVWREPVSAHNDFGRDGRRYPILARSVRSDDRGESAHRELVDQWVDLERAVVLDAAPLELIGGAEPRSLVVRQAAMGARELMLLDVRAATLQTVATYTDCPGELRVVEQAGAHVAVVCQVQPNARFFRYDHVWTEVLDLDRRVRARTTLFPEAVLADGRVLASDRRRDWYESVNTFRRARLVTLP